MEWDKDEIWKKMYSLIEAGKCTDIELKTIIRQWEILMGKPTKEGANHKDILYNVKNTINDLKMEMEAGKDYIVPESIKILKYAESIKEADIEELLKIYKGGGKMKKYDKVFISHAKKDEKYVKALVDFLEDIGLEPENIFCTSIAEYGVPINDDFDVKIREQFTKYDILVLYVLSDFYYSSAACLNEMGAAWILQKEYSTILLPGFKTKNIAGGVNPRQIGLDLNDSEENKEYRLEELRDRLMEDFGISKKGGRKWDRAINEFLAKVR